jgi:hypothetical protein
LALGHLLAACFLGHLLAAHFFEHLLAAHFFEHLLAAHFLEQCLLQWACWVVQEQPLLHPEQPGVETEHANTNASPKASVATDFNMPRFIYLSSVSSSGYNRSGRPGATLRNRTRIPSYLTKKAMRWKEC